MKLIANAGGKWWRLWSLRWAAVKSALIAAALANPLTVLDTMRELSRPMRIVVPLVLLAVFWGLDAAFRLTHQPKVAASASPQQ